MWISSHHSSEDWRRLRGQLPDNGQLSPENGRYWDQAVDVMRDRIDTRFMRAARLLSEHENSGFVLLLVDSIVVEYVQRLRTARLHDEGASRELVSQFLRERRHFRDVFADGTHSDDARPCRCVACDFYRDARSGIAHYGETRSDWMVRYGQGTMLHRENGARVIDRNMFHRALEDELADYYGELVEPTLQTLRRTLKDALDLIAGVTTPHPTRRGRRLAGGAGPAGDTTELRPQLNTPLADEPL